MRRLAAILCLFVAGCLNASDRPGIECDGETDRADMVWFFPLRTYVAGSWYDMPTKRGVETVWHASFHRRSWKSDLQCAYIASAFMDLCAEVHHYDNRTGADGIAVGEFWYHPARGETNHALNVVLTRASRAPLFFEPQTGAWVNLTPAEIKSCTLCRF